MEHADDTWPRLGEGKLPTEDEEIGLGHIPSVDTYHITLATLLLLTVVTVLAAMVDFGVLNLLIALGIATTKAAIVTLFFMHLNWEHKIVWGIVIYPLFIFALILGGTLGDAVVQPKIEPRAAAVVQSP